MLSGESIPVGPLGKGPVSNQQGSSPAGLRVLCSAPTGQEKFVQARVVKGQFQNFPFVFPTQGPRQQANPGKLSQSHQADLMMLLSYSKCIEGILLPSWSSSVAECALPRP